MRIGVLVKRLFVLLTVIVLAMPVGEAFSFQDENAIKIYRNEQGAASLLTGDLGRLNETGSQAVSKALTDKSQLLEIDPAFDFKSMKVIKDNIGMTHIKLKQTYSDIPIYGKEAILHLDDASNILGITANLAKNGTTETVEGVAISNEDAIELAEDAVNAPSLIEERTSELMWYEFDEKLVLIYVVRVNFLGEKPGQWCVFVDAETGQILKKINGLKYETQAIGSGIGVLGDVKSPLDISVGSTVYQMKDMIRNIQTYDIFNNYNEEAATSIIKSSDDFFDEPRQYAGVDAHFFSALANDFYENHFGRNGVEGNGDLLKLIVHLGTNYENAFWYATPTGGNRIFFGDGNGVTTKPLSDSIEIVSHEFTHGVTEYTCNLEYAYQSGALNESLSDTFGMLIEGEYEGSFDWLIGEDFGEVIRSMKDPALYGQPADMDHYQNLPYSYDNGGVHINAGIPNKAAYLIITGVGPEKAAEIYYRAMCYYLTTTSSFVDFANALLQVTTDLYGEGGAEYVTVRNAFISVGILNEVIPPPAIPTGLSASAGVDYVTLTWTSNPETDISGYNVYISENDVLYDQINMAPLAETTYKVDGLTTGKDYYFKLSAVNTSGVESEKTASVKATPAIAAGEITGSIILQPYQKSDLSGYRVSLLSNEIREAVTVSDGSFNYVDVAPGTYHVLVTIPGYTPGALLNVIVDYSASIQLSPIAMYGGDANSDQKINLSDFGILVDAFNSVPGSPNWNKLADFSADNQVNLSDFGILSDNFGKAAANMVLSESWLWKSFKKMLPIVQ
ncbi:MAG: M4 family metallopeptidase [Desulfotomaculaceae bacterium]|nr:M4 family metallopeptidase [Desulfotomaculaceae bacterium]